MASGVEWDDDRVRRNIQRAPERLDAAMAAIITRNAAVGESRMKSLARWTDRTGNARQGLHGVADRDKLNYYMVVLAHAVSYGVYLETRYNGRYAIIEPTVVYVGNKVMQETANLFEEVFG